MDSAPAIPSNAASKEALTALRALRGFPARKSPRSIEVKLNGTVSVSVPKGAFDLFLEVLGQIANGNAVTIVPVHAELTTQQAAEMLNVSRPFVVKLIDEGELPCRLVGTHRRIKMADVVKYKKRDLAKRTKALNELANESQKHGLGY